MVGTAIQMKPNSLDEHRMAEGTIATCLAHILNKGRFAPKQLARGNMSPKEASTTELETRSHFLSYIRGHSLCYTKDVIL